ncbi:hypothetical protein [Herbiconiux sp. L3-i23]|uniref:hypothetical protein n=1 Tax=Herbiconiux sp. L3-i23 TaxID=2905871 RepID=UPI0020606D47|nr:hypothetical protein [Herbiconiux sp. L3-i23]BDI23013.1 hypothetical protein L3i23_17890 [Herbiconiux sp. L3-i23]
MVGGVFTLLGQARQAEAQRKMQTEQFSAEEKSALGRWEREQRGLAVSDSLESATELFKDFTALQRSIQAAQPSISDILSGASWVPVWRQMWTEDMSLDLDVKSRLLADDDARIAVQRIVQLLDSASDFAKEDMYPTHPTINMRLRNITGHLTAEGVEVVGAYIRRVPHTSNRLELMVSLETARTEYLRWEEREMEAAENYEPDDAPIPGGKGPELPPLPQSG